MDFYNTICRLCEASDKFNEKWLHLFATGSEQLLAKIRECTNLTILKRDKLPKRICNSCQRKIEQSYAFKVQCEITNAKLQHEIDFLEKNQWNTAVTIPPFDSSGSTANRNVKKEEHETSAPGSPAAPVVEPVFIKAEMDESQQLPSDEEDLYSASVEVQLQANKLDEAIDEETSSDRSVISEKVEDSDYEDSQAAETSKEKSYVCETCEEKFTRAALLYAHMKTVHGKKRHQCSQCPRSFSRKSRLENHQLQHLGICQYECQHCDRKYSSQQGLKNHIDDVHTGDLPYVCDKCGKAFSKECKLRNHYSLHIETRNFMCSICSKGYKTQVHLNMHMNVHLPDGQKKVRKRQDRKKVCVCPFCGKVSNSIGTHTMHIRTHTGEQRYECHICFKRFTSSGSHKKHLRVHSGEKPYECEFCQKQFRQKHHMTTHIRGVHTNEKPYQCRYCPRAFATRGNMTLHERSHGGGGGSVEAVSAAGGKQEIQHALASISSVEANMADSPPHSSPMMVSSAPSPMMNPGILAMHQSDMFYHNSQTS